MQNSNTQPNPELFEQHYQYQKARRYRGLLKFAAIVLIGFAIASAMALGYICYSRLQLSSQIPQTLRDNIDFPVYLPGQSKFRSEEPSFKYSNGILLFLAGSKDDPLTVSEQKVPADFDLSKFSTGEGLTETTELTVHGHRVLLGKVHGLNIAIIDTGQTIVTITSAAAQPSATIESIVRSLQKI